MPKKLTVRDIEVQGKRVLCRVDFNVPLKDGEITDDTRIRAALKTINFLLDKGAKLILASHLGRPKGEVKPEMSLKPAAKRLGELIGKDVKMAPDCVGPEVEKIANALKPGEVVLLENTRFHKEEDEKPDKETKKFSPARQEFAQKMAGLADLYVNDAFGTAHRDHVSTCGVTQFIKPAAMGFLIEEEVKAMAPVRENPESPYVAILGGAKISDKIKIIDSIIDKADVLLIGGGMAYTFLKLQGKEIGNSILDKYEESKPKAEAILKKAKDKGCKVVLPVDVLVADKVDFKGDSDADATVKIVSTDAIPSDYEGLDVGPRSIAAYIAEIQQAKTILWNGPLGVFEKERYAVGTLAVAQAIAVGSAYSVVGGGDSIAAMTKFGLEGNFNHVSTGGGASLEYLAGFKLPGIEALTGA